MGCVVVGAVGATRCDDTDRWLLAQHRADLHAGCLGAQNAVPAIAFGRQVERVVVGPGGVVFGRVERGEVVPVGLDVRTFGHGEAHRAEDGGDFLDGLTDRVEATARGFDDRHGDIDTFGGKPCIERGGLDLAATVLDGAGQFITKTVKLGATHLALFGVHASELLEQSGQSARLSEKRDTDGVPGTLVGGFRKGREAVLPECINIVAHVTSSASRAPLVAGRNCLLRARIAALAGGEKPGEQKTGETRRVPVRRCK